LLARWSISLADEWLRWLVRFPEEAGGEATCWASVANQAATRLRVSVPVAGA
jgi:hypothetical protein